MSKVGNANRYAKARKDREAKRDADILRLTTESRAVAVVGFPLYLVTPCGNVYSTFWRMVRRISPGVKPGGYEFVGLRGDGGQKYRMVHRLVAQAFVGNPDNLPEVNHKDGNKRNNSADNLEWVTRQQNTVHAYEIGAMKRGSLSPRSKLTSEQISEIKSLDGKYRDIGKVYGVCAQTVCNVKSGKRAA